MKNSALMQGRALAAGIAFTLFAAVSNSGANAADQVVFGTVPIAGDAAAWVGRDAGYFEEEGIDLEIADAVQFANIVADVMAGTYNFGTVSVGTAAQAIIEGLPIQIVANTYHSAGE
jgi:NitT/TauT family transport system substrate-binding protein